MINNKLRYIEKRLGIPLSKLSQISEHEKGEIFEKLRQICEEIQNDSDFRNSTLEYIKSKPEFRNPEPQYVVGQLVLHTHLLMILGAIVGYKLAVDLQAGIVDYLTKGACIGGGSGLALAITNIDGYSRKPITRAIDGFRVRGLQRKIESNQSKLDSINGIMAQIEEGM